MRVAVAALLLAACASTKTHDESIVLEIHPVGDLVKPPNPGITELAAELSAEFGDDGALIDVHKDVLVIRATPPVQDRIRARLMQRRGG